MNNEPCAKCGEYHGCTELILQQQAEIDKLRQDYVDLAVAHQNTLLELKFGVKNERK